MARRVTDAEGESADSQLVAVGQVAVGGGQPLGAQAEGDRLVRCVIVQEAGRTPSACSLWAIIPASSPGSMIAHSRDASSITK